MPRPNSIVDAVVLQQIEGNRRWERVLVTDRVHHRGRCSCRHEAASMSLISRAAVGHDAEEHDAEKWTDSDADE